MYKTNMLELLEKISNIVKDYWEKEGSEEDGSFKLKDDKKNLYGDKFVELMRKAVFGDEIINTHTEKDIALGIKISAPTFSKIKTMSTNLQPENLKKIVEAILFRIYREEKGLDDEMKEQVSELLFRIFRRKEIKGIVENFVILSGDNSNHKEEWCVRKESHVDQSKKIFGNPEEIQDLTAYEDYEYYFIDGGITEDEMESYINRDILFIDYMLEDKTKIHVVIFDVNRLDREYLRQRIRCLQRKNNVFAILMVEKGACYDDISFYQDERSNIMAIEYEAIWKGNFEVCTFEYLRGMCLSWYDEKCKAFMMEGINKIFVSHK